MPENKLAWEEGLSEAPDWSPHTRHLIAVIISMWTQLSSAPIYWKAPAEIKPPQFSLALL